MHTKSLIQRIYSCTALLESKRSLATWVHNNPENIPLLFDIGLDNQHPDQHKAAWVMELILMNDLSLIEPKLAQFQAQFPNIKNESVKRSLGKIAWLLTESKTITLNHDQKTILIETALGWLIDNTKVAGKCLAISIILNLSPDFPDLAALANESIELQYASSSPAFQNRARRFKSRFKPM